MEKGYNLSFTEILDKMKDYNEGTVIESQRGDCYRLERLAKSKKRWKFSRVKGTSLKFMSYNNVMVSFRIVEDEKKDELGDFGIAIEEKLNDLTAEYEKKFSRVRILENTIGMSIEEYEELHELWDEVNKLKIQIELLHELLEKE